MSDSPSAIYMAAEGETGKAIIALGLLHRLTAIVAKVGVFRPITPLGEPTIPSWNCCWRMPPPVCPRAVRRRDVSELHSDPDAALTDIIDSLSGWPIGVTRW